MAISGKLIRCIDELAVACDLLSILGELVRCRSLVLFQLPKTLWDLRMVSFSIALAMFGQVSVE